MTINEMIQHLEKNYEEIDAFEHICAWSNEIATGYNTFATCIFVNLKHKVAIQSMVYYPTRDDVALEGCPIYQIYIGQDEDNNKIHRAFRYVDTKKVPLSYMEIVMIEDSMGWIELPEENVISKEE